MRKYTASTSTKFTARCQKKVFVELLKAPRSATEQMPGLDWWKFRLIHSLQVASRPWSIGPCTLEEAAAYGREIDLEALKAGAAQYSDIRNLPWRLEEAILGYVDAREVHADAERHFHAAYGDYWLLLLSRFEKIMNDDRVQREVLETYFPDAVRYFSDVGGKVDASVVGLQDALGHADFTEWASLRVASGIGKSKVMPFVFQTRQKTIEAISSGAFRVGGQNEISVVAFKEYLTPCLGIDGDWYLSQEHKRRAASKDEKRASGERKVRLRHIKTIEGAVEALEGVNLTFDERVRCSKIIESLKRIAQRR